MRAMVVVSAILSWLLLISPARANDSMAETALGGLTLTKSDAISMDSEELYISRGKVRVTYRFTNATDQPIDALVAFPLPDLEPAGEDENRNIWNDPGADLKFSTRADGQPIPLHIVEQALFKGQDIGARLAALRIPLNDRAETFSAAINRLPKADRDKLAADGLIRDGGMSNEQLWDRLWTLRTIVTRRQLFPAKATLTIEHEYAPLSGGSIGGSLEPDYRGGDNAKDFSETRRKYCIEDDWLKSFDRKLKTAKKPDGVAYNEIWLGYVLNTGANWKGPIKDFRLVVDKGEADVMVSFCANGVNKISPTQFEWRRQDFTPREDLNILIVDWN